MAMGGPGERRRLPIGSATGPETIRIAMWSGPRNISTAMMRAWSSRADTQVVDEPFYAAYLASTGLGHPMREAVLASQSQNWDEVARACATDDRAPIVFQKHMCQHMLPEAPLGWMDACRHAFLIRPPAEVAASFNRKWAGMTADDLGFRRQAELFDRVCQLTSEALDEVLGDGGPDRRRRWCWPVTCSAIRRDYWPRSAARWGCRGIGRC